MAETTFLNELRSATADMHKKLEQTDISRSIMSPQLSLQQYQKYLQKVHQLHDGVEETVFPLVSGYLSDIEERRKVPALITDFKNTATTLTDGGLRFINNAFKQDPAFCMGIMYVSEGSTLGGLYIVKNVNAALGDRVQDATRFFNVYGANTGSKWKTFLQELDNFQSTCNEVQRQSIVDGAHYGFERTYELFNN